MNLHQHQALPLSICSGCFSTSPTMCPPIDLITQKTMVQAAGAQLAARIGSRPVYVVLDFDGVLHADTAGPWKSELKSGFLDRDSLEARLVRGNAEWDTDSERIGPRPGELFDRAWLLREMLDRLPTARIVISTSWRTCLDLNELKRTLPPALANRVVGVLPKSDDHLVEGARERLFRAWLNEQMEEDVLWVALDDQPHHYATGCPRLVQTSTAGLDDDAIAAVLDCLLDQV